MNTPTSSQKNLAMACGLALSSHGLAADYVYDDFNRLIKVTYESGKPFITTMMPPVINEASPPWSLNTQ